MADILLVHYSEIGTKGKNRSNFERKLRESIHRKLAPDHVSNVRIESGRIVAALTPGYKAEAVRAALDQVFGVAWYAYAKSVSWDEKEISGAVLEAVADRPAGTTFKIYCKRADKSFPMSSDAVCRKMGQLVVDTRGLKVDLDNHDAAVYVEILPGMTCVYKERVQGLRGMPRGSSGKMLCLFSGGIDSPAAAWQLMRRGALVHLLHFHPFRKAEDIKDSKVFGLYSVLQNYNPNLKMYLIPHYHYQVKAALEISTAYEMVLFRRFMFRAAQELARRRGFQALITGDSLGQVASQTVENIAAAQADLGIPIFLPLISFDKDDIIRIAQKIGTFELSTQAYKDCCSLMSRHPKTMVSVEKIRAMEEKLGFAQLIEDSLDSMEVWNGETLKAEPASPRRVPV